MIKDRAARLLSEIFAPAVLVAALMLIIGWHAGDTPGVSRWWGLPGALFAAGIPLAYILRGVRQGRLTSHHIPEREARRIPMLVGLGCVLTGLAALALLGAPRDVIALLAAGGTGLAIFAVVTHWWKMSIHAGVAAGTATTLAAIYGPLTLTVAVPLVVLSCWSRVRLSAHTLAQVLAGAAVGALIAGSVFPALR